MPSPKGDVIFDHRHNAAMRVVVKQAMAYIVWQRLALMVG
jgi:hypothetical protein